MVRVGIGSIDCPNRVEDLKSKALMAPFFASVFVVNRLLKLEQSLDGNAVIKGQYLRAEYAVGACLSVYSVIRVK